jgi:hypothetical protein
VEKFNARSAPPPPCNLSGVRGAGSSIGGLRLPFDPANASYRSLSTLVDVAPLANRHHQHGEHVMLDGVDDAEVADADA